MFNKNRHLEILYPHSRIHVQQEQYAPLAKKRDSRNMLRIKERLPTFIFRRVSHISQ